MKRAASLVLTCGVTLAFVLPGCGEKKPAQAPEGDVATQEGSGVETTSTTPSTDDEGKKKGAGGGAKAPGDDGDEKKDPNACTGFQFDMIDFLSKAACEIPTPPADAKSPDLKGILEIKVTPSSDKVAPGGHADLVVTFTNKSKAPLPLQFTVNPFPRFEIETYDAKARRVDMPAGEHPAYPASMKPPPEAESKVARITIAPNGTGRASLGWDATKMKWAPDKVKGAAMGSGYPRAPAGPLPKGKYTLRVVTPLIGVFEGADHEVSAPKIDVTVGK